MINKLDIYFKLFHFNIVSFDLLRGEGVNFDTDMKKMTAAAGAK